LREGLRSDMNINRLRSRISASVMARKASATLV